MEKLEREKVRKLFYKCLFKNEEMIDGRPSSDFTPVSSINPDKNLTVCFCTDRLNSYKREIIEYIDQLADDVSSLDDLFFDINGFKWCEDIQTVDQLIQLALGCNIISYEMKNDIVSIKRLKENDDLIVNGHSPDELPKEERILSSEEKKLLEKNRKLIGKELNEYISIINLGLGFFGIHAVINNDNVNQLDFYDKDNALLYSRQFDDSCGIRVLDFGVRLSTEFFDKYENRITYFLDESRDFRHGFILISPKSEKYGYKVELTYDIISAVLKRVEVRTESANDDYIIKNFLIDDYDLRAELNNQFGQFGNYVDGERREIWYRTPDCNRYNPSFFMIEDYLSNRKYNYHHIVGGLNGFSIDKNNLTGPLSYIQFDNISINIARHPRNKETIEFVIDELNNSLPGIKELIINNFPIYNDIMNGEYVSELIIDDMINKTIQEKCDIKKKSKKYVKSNN